MINAELLKNVGVDYDSGLKRFMDDPELYEAVLTAFAEEDTLERARDAFQDRDCDRLMNVVHEAKGSGGNAGLDGIYAEASALVKLLRAGSFAEEDLTSCFRRFDRVYDKTRNGIFSALGQM